MSDMAGSQIQPGLPTGGSPSNLPGMARLNMNRKKIPRNREVQACHQCRSRKVRCDQSKPRCQKCVAQNRACSYQPGRTEERRPIEVPRGRAPLTKRPRTTGSLEDTLQNPDDRISLNQRGHLRATSSIPVRYYSSSSWMAAEDSEYATPRPGSELGPGVSPSGVVDSQQYLSLAEGNIDEFLQQSEVDYLLSWYSNYCHFFHPILDISEVTASLHSFRRERNAPPSFLALIAAICYSAACSINVSGDINPLSLVPSSIWKDMADELLSLSEYPFRPTLDTLRAALLLATPSSAEENTRFDPGPVCVLLRAAQSLGLHREPSSFQLSARDADLRRVLWWSIHGLDVSYATAHALPPLVHPATYDVHMVGSEGRLDRKLISTVIRASVLMSKTFHEIYGVRQPTYNDIKKLDTEAAETCADEVANTHLPQTTTLERFLAMSRRMTCWKMVFILHQPYLRSTQCPQDSRPKALSACQDYINEFVTSATDPTLVSYRWVLNHFNVIHPCAILLQDLIQNPKSADSDAIRATVDTCYSTLSTDRHSNWEKLTALRSKAWIANQWALDEQPAVVPSGEDASLSDWDPLFASLVWDDLSLPEIG